MNTFTSASQKIPGPLT